MLSLTLVFAALALAPVLDRALAGRPRLESFGDGLVQVIVVGIVALDLLPDALGSVGPAALLTLGLGALAGTAIHRIPGAERSAGMFAVGALLLHAATDGLVLEVGGGTSLVVAVVVHTLPVGLASWRIAKERAGVGAAIALLVATALATTLGPTVLAPLMGHLPEGSLALAQTAGAGVLLHVVAHLGDDDERSAAGAGGLAGAVVVGFMAAAHPWPVLHPGTLSAGVALQTLALHAAPGLLGGYVAGGLAHAFVPRNAWRWLKGPLPALRGALFGIPTPSCACGAPAVADDLRTHGAPAPAIVAFLVGGSTITAAPMLVAVPMLGAYFAGAWILAGLAAAILAGAWVPRLKRAGLPIAPAPAGDRLRTALRFGGIAMVDHSAPWVLVGLGVASVMEPMLRTDAFTMMQGALPIGIAAALGVPAYVCAAGAVPLVVVLLHKGAAAGVVLPMLITGSTLSVATLVDLDQRYGRAVTVRIVGAVVGVAVAVGLALTALPAPPMPSLQAAADHAHGAVEIGSVLILVVLYAAALVRNGPEGFVEPLRHPQAPGERTEPGTHTHHVHGPGHHHGHRH